ncbi:MAG: AMP-binding protein [Steroidobacteraceae bacterium]
MTIGLGNSVEPVIAAFAAFKMGAVLNPVNPNLGAGELSYVIGDAERVLADTAGSSGNVTSPDLTAPRGNDARRLRRRPRRRARPDARPHPTKTAAIEVGPSDGSTLLYTSGTTGKPKGVLFTHGRTGGARRVLHPERRHAPDDVLSVRAALRQLVVVRGTRTAGQVPSFPRAFSTSSSGRSRTAPTRASSPRSARSRDLPPREANEGSSARVPPILGLNGARSTCIRERFGISSVMKAAGRLDHQRGATLSEPLGQKPRPGSARPRCNSSCTSSTTKRELAVREVGEIAVESRSAWRPSPATTRRPSRRCTATGSSAATCSATSTDGWLCFVDRGHRRRRRGGEHLVGAGRRRSSIPRSPTSRSWASAATCSSRWYFVVTAGGRRRRSAFVAAIWRSSVPTL